MPVPAPPDSGRDLPSDARASVSRSVVAKLDAAKSQLLHDAAASVNAVAKNVLHSYWGLVAPEDLVDRSAHDIASTVQHHLDAGAARKANQAVVVVREPRTGHSGHTDIDIVTDDMPFLVDSVTAALQRSGRTIALVVHPQFAVQRDGAGNLVALSADGDSQGVAESWMHIECALDPESPEDDFSEVAELVRSTLSDVRAAVADWQLMTQQAVNVAQALGSMDAEATEAAEFLRWMADNRFTFLGYREYDLTNRDGQDFLVPRAGTGLGVLRDADTEPTRLSAAASDAARDPRVLVLTKANSRATVHRNVYLDYVGVKQFNADGSVAGEARFLGLFTSSAYVQPVQEVPVVAGKVAAVVEQSGLSPDSHSGKDLLEFLENYPRDELLQIDVTDLRDTALAVLQIAGRHVTRVFLRADRYGRFVSAVVYLPRDRYNSQVRRSIEQILIQQFNAFSVDTTSRVGEQMHARLHIVARVNEPVKLSDEIVQTVRTLVASAARSWDDGFADAVLERLGEREGARVLRNWMGKFPAAYQADHTAQQAVSDAILCEGLHVSGAKAQVQLRRQNAGASSTHLFTLYTTAGPVSLSSVLPLLQNLGVQVADERPYECADAIGRKTRIYEFGIDVPGDIDDAETLDERFGEAFLAAWHGETENFYLDAVVTYRGMTARQATILRAYARYLRQTNLSFSMRYLEEIILDHAAIARGLVSLFATKFDPTFADDRISQTAHINAQLERELDRVVSLDADRLLRGMVTLVNATVRTNAYLVSDDGSNRPYLSFKFDSQRLGSLLPSPLPLFEMWVCSPHVEGVHLRFGKVARGGLRWSDRRDDVRTEVLGLVKAQMVKNTVIVPVGAKGGFVVQHPHTAADARMEQGIECYRTFIRGMLDLTDTIVEGAVVAAPGVVRYDDDDPYLVVAADKGTATFSDIANGISAEYGFWLADAFASGGSAGYDHKAMGITAKGAWESVKRHFRELGVDTQQQDFTVIGVGDMSGDVFGNGMLCSEHIRLVAAFDHRHIFVDPNPDAATSYAERVRMFAVPRSSWADYNVALISAGGGVFPRDAKSIAVSPQMAAALSIDDSVVELTPSELISVILKAPVDLLWNGGIGTYVKSTSESHADAGDKANDNIRVNGSQLRCKVVGEGGNLGFTQLGRVEAARAGVKLNTDAVDNSAGVDTSDHEVNIKIFFDPLVRGGVLSLAERDSLLADMTDEVAVAVLRDNYLQNVVLGNARARASQLIGAHRRFIDELEETGVLVRSLESLPTDAELERLESDGQGLTSPELSVLLAYAKLQLNEQLTQARTASEAGIRDSLPSYFPPLMQRRYGKQLLTHPLRDELITTMLVNEIVNRGGITFAFRAREETGADYGAIARAFTASRLVFNLDSIWSRIEALDGQISTLTQSALHLEVRRLLDRATRWFIVTRGTDIDVPSSVNRLSPVVSALATHVPGWLRGAELARLQSRTSAFTLQGVPEDLAVTVASLLDVFSLLDVAEIAERVGSPAESVGSLYFTISERYDIDRLLVAITALPRSDRWGSLARAAMRADVYSALASLTARVLRASAETEATARITAWESQNATAVALARETVREVFALPEGDLATLSVAVRSIRSLLTRSDTR